LSDSAVQALPDIPYSVEVKRKLIHLFSLSIPFGIWFFPRITMAAILFIALAGSLALDLARHFVILQMKWWQEVAALFRPKEKGSLSGSTYILLSALLLTLFFHREIAALALAYIVVGDIAGALIGRKFGRRRLFGKTWEGSSAFFLACFLPSFFVPGLPWPAKLAGAAVAAMVEALPLKLDDNLTVPLATAGVLALLA
jgi:dolichol kinase